MEYHLDIVLRNEEGEALDDIQHTLEATDENEAREEFAQWL